MCGLSGFLSVYKISEIERKNILDAMANAIGHRGPDGSGSWIDSDAQFGFCHRRLAIVDLSSAGHQPMLSPSARYVISFNGEIYNHFDLRDELKRSGIAPIWKGQSDTETLLAAFDAWGIRSGVERCIGMFAFAVWDRVDRVLILGRDRMGEKPLYYGWQGSGGNSSFLFASEIKALKAHPAFTNEINRDALCAFTRYSCIPAPHSIFHGISKLKPGCLLRVSLTQRDPQIQEYWSLPNVAIAGVASPFIGSDDQVVDDLEILLKSAVGKQMVSDVPIGAFLSGGIDSSIVVALMQAQSISPVKTFSIGFSESGYNEADHAKAVASHLGTDHTELYVTPREALDVIPKLPVLYCEPFSDSSQIPTFLVSQLARQKVAVSLSGDAGDELFGGYNRYVMTHNLWGKICQVPAPLRKIAAAGIDAISPNAWDSFSKPIQSFLPSSLNVVNFGEKLRKSGMVLGADCVEDLYSRLITHWQLDEVVIGGKEPINYLLKSVFNLSGLDDVQRMMVCDAIGYLPDDILVKVDRASMGVSLEGRVPFLDHRVVEFAWRVPQSLKLRQGVGKWILRQILNRYVPKRLFERPKMGFGVPIDAWLRGPLRDWAENLLDERRLKQDGFFNPLPIRKKWAEHLSGSHNWQHHLWDVLMFQAWLSEHD